MPLQFSDDNEYINLCIGYRIVSILLSTIGFLALSEHSSTQMVIIIGMLSACAVGTYLYYRLFAQTGNERMMSMVIGLEMIAYGGFIFLSGGFSSPYLWYLIGCLFIMAAAGHYRGLMLLALSWCLVCAALSRPVLRPEQKFTYLDINVCISVFIVLGGFYILLTYVQRLDEHRQAQRLLSDKLLVEKERSELALVQIMDMYDTIGLLAITDREMVMKELTELLGRSVLPEGCLLMKYDLDKTIELRASDKLSDEAVIQLVEQLSPLCLVKDELEQMQLVADKRSYGLRVIGEGVIVRGVLAAPAGNLAAGVWDKKTEPFYLKMTDIIFRNLDIQKSIEQYIISEEQNRIANEIHDTVIQKLFGLACALKVLESKAEELTGENLQQQLSNIEKSVESTMQELREAIYDLRFGSGDGAEFIRKLEDYMAEVREMNAVDIALDIESCAQPMSASQKTIIYRLTCEAVNNAVRHGRAKTIKVLIAADKREIRATISDNGVGFGTKGFNGEGSGLKNMYQMISLLKGQLDLESGEKGGAVVRFVLPR